MNQRGDEAEQTSPPAKKSRVDERRTNQSGCNSGESFEQSASGSRRQAPSRNISILQEERSKKILNVRSRDVSGDGGGGVKGDDNTPISAGNKHTVLIAYIGKGIIIFLESFLI